MPRLEARIRLIGVMFLHVPTCSYMFLHVPTIPCPRSEIVTIEIWCWPISSLRIRPPGPGTFRTWAAFHKDAFSWGCIFNLPIRSLSKDDFSIKEKGIRLQSEGAGHANMTCCETHTKHTEHRAWKGNIQKHLKNNVSPRGNGPRSNL